MVRDRSPSLDLTDHSFYFLYTEAGKIQVYVRVRPFTEKEKEKREPNAIEIHQEHSLVCVTNLPNHGPRDTT